MTENQVTGLVVVGSVFAVAALCSAWHFATWVLDLVRTNASLAERATQLQYRLDDARRGVRDE